MRAFHVLFLLTAIFCGVGGAICVIVWDMLMLLHIFFIVFMVLMLLFWWCTQRILIASGSIRGSVNYGGLVGSSYLVVSTGMLVITYVS